MKVACKPGTLCSFAIQYGLRGDELVLKPRPRHLGRAFQLLASLPADFMEDGRQDDPPQSREEF